MTDSQQHLQQQNQINDPPDIGSMQIDDANMHTQPTTFLQTLLTDKYLSPTLSNQIPSLNTSDLADKIIHNPTDDDMFIPLH